jgi:hypothetical protein
MPTKENSAGQQQAYDPNSGEYGEGSSNSSEAKKNGRQNPSIIEGSSPWGTSYTVDFGDGKKAVFIDKSKAESAVNDWDKSSESAFRAESVLDKANEGKEITLGEAEDMAKAFSEPGSRVYLSSLKNSGKYDSVLQIGKDKYIGSIIELGNGDFVHESIIFGQDGPSLSFSVISRKDLSDYFQSSGTVNDFKTFKEAKDALAKGTEFSKAKKEKNKSAKEEYLNIKDSDKALDFLSDPENEKIILSDEPLYENDSKDSSSGGYAGYSMSNRAVKAYENGQKPLSKWKKQDIIDTIEFSADELEPFQKEISSMSESEIKANLLEQSSWHHTGKLYNSTDFYGVKSPKDIVAYIRYKKGQS